MEKRDILKALVLAWKNDIRFKTKLSLYVGFLWNFVYCVFNICLGVYHSTFWYISIAMYCFLLGVMRLYLASHVKRYKPCEKPELELKKYKNCGIIMLFMSVSLSGMVFFMVYFGRTFVHHQITAIAMATYTFTSFAFAVTDTVKYKKYHSPLLSASKIIGLAAACVSMLTLTSTLLSAFENADNTDEFKKIMLLFTGIVVSGGIVALALSMIINYKRNKNGKQKL